MGGPTKGQQPLLPGHMFSVLCPWADSASRPSSQRQMMGKCKLNSSQNSHQGVFEPWESTWKMPFVRRVFPAGRTAIKGKCPPRGSETPQPSAAAQQPPGGRGWTEERQEPRETAQPFSVKQPGWDYRPRQGPGKSRARRSLRGASRRVSSLEGNLAMAVKT